MCNAESQSWRYTRKMCAKYEWNGLVWFGLVGNENISCYKMDCAKNKDTHTHIRTQLPVWIESVTTFNQMVTLDESHKMLHEIKRQSSMARISCHRHTNGKYDYNPFHRFGVRAQSERENWECARERKQLSKQTTKTNRTTTSHHDGKYTQYDLWLIPNYMRWT